MQRVDYKATCLLKGLILGAELLFTEARFVFIVHIGLFSSASIRSSTFTGSNRLRSKSPYESMSVVPLDDEQPAALDN